MKTRLILSVILSLSSALCALSQIPQGFNYQAIARDASGNPIVNTAMPVRITIQSEQTGGTIFWQELHSSVTTNDFGMLTLVVGKGTRQAGTAATFADIDWSVTPKYIKTEIDYGGWKEMGVSPLWSVPYAQVAKSSEQWTSSDSTIYRLKGKVGIGTNSPLFKLDVTGDARITGVFRPNWIEVSADATGNRYSGIDFHGDDTYSDYSLRIYRYNTGPDAYSRIWHRGLGPLQLFTNEAAPIDFYTSGSHRLRIDGNGNFGIGTSTPAYKLDVNGEIASRNKTAFRLKQATYSMLLRNDDKDFWFLLTDKDKPDTTWNSLRPFRIELSTGNVFLGNGALTVFHGGNVGIGTTTPSSRMVIQPTGTWDDNIPIFEVKNKIGVPILAVYNNGVKILVEDTDGKGVKGGFAIGGFDPTKGAGDETVNLMTVSPDSIRLFIDNSAAKGVKGGFAIGSFDESKGTIIPKDFMSISPQSSSSGQFNTFAGYQAGKNMKGLSNTCIGMYAGMGLAGSMSSNNIFIGQGAGKENYGSITFVNKTLPNGWVIRMPVWTGGGNVAIGNYSGPMLYGGSTDQGMDNVFLGNYTGNSMTTGSKNVFIGHEAGAKNVSGTNNVFIGYNAGYNETGSNKLYIESSYNSDKNNSLIYGEFDNDMLRINGKLEVSGNIEFTSGANRYMILPDKTRSLFIGGKVGLQSAYAIHLITDNGSNAGVERLSIIGNLVGINTVSPTQTLDVNGNARFRSMASDAYYGPVNRKSDGTLTTATSDIRMKENIQTLRNSLDKILQLRGVSFTWKTEPEMGTRIGMIAQEVEKVLPELVFVNNADGYKGINYAEMSAVLVEAIKEQQKIIESQKEELESLKERLSAIEAMVGNK